MPRAVQPPTRPTATCCSAAAAINDRAPGDANGFRAVGEGEAPRGKSARLYGGARLPGREDIRTAAERAALALADSADHGGAETEGARRRFVEPIPAGKRIRRRADKPRIRAALRDPGPLADCTRGLQLLGARYRQYGNVGPLWHEGTAGALAEAAALGRDPLVFCDDRAGCRVLRCDQHRGVDPP